MKYLLDTNIISEFISKKPNQKVLDYINSLDENDIYLSVITIGEIRFGIEKLDIEHQSKKIEVLSSWLNNDLMQRFEGRIVHIDKQTMLKWGEINGELQKIGRPMPIMDSLIASSCLTKGFILITRNTKDFYNFEIEMVNPFL
ncbi:MAG TPA: type II toxin-antitoxin system VapC family toxin [Bacteroidetes bacterium]|nr:type II toxin-antitoxin system VapC family toxin [Bacteroidota bacterium]